MVPLALTVTDPPNSGVPTEVTVSASPSGSLSLSSTSMLVVPESSSMVRTSLVVTGAESAAGATATETVVVEPCPPPNSRLARPWMCQGLASSDTV